MDLVILRLFRLAIKSRAMLPCEVQEVSENPTPT